MKKIALILLAAVIFSFNTDNAAKYKVELSLEDWIKYSNGLEAVRQHLNQSDLPAKTVKILTDSVITPLSREIGVQVSKQLPKDSTKKK